MIGGEYLALPFSGRATQMGRVWWGRQARRWSARRGREAGRRGGSSARRFFMTRISAWSDAAPDRRTCRRSVGLRVVNRRRAWVGFHHDLRFVDPSVAPLPRPARRRSLRALAATPLPRPRTTASSPHRKRAQSSVHLSNQGSSKRSTRQQTPAFTNRPVRAPRSTSSSSPPCRRIQPSTTRTPVRTTRASRQLRSYRLLGGACW